MPDIQTTIIGAGVVGLACAAALARAGHEVLVVERNSAFGEETSARNSEVIHAGIYYPKDSLKARLCVAGKRLLYGFCREHGVDFRQTGKLIVATRQEQLATLSEIRSRAEANGVMDLEAIDQARLLKMEPALNGCGALVSPSTGILDSHGFMLALQGVAQAHGCQFAFNASISQLEKQANGDFLLGLDGSSYEFTSRNVVVSAGLGSSNLLRTSAIGKLFSFPQTWYAKGNYFSLSGKSPFSHLIYPVPEAGGLGVHLTVDLGNNARFGPDVEWVNELDYAVEPARANKFYQAIRQYWPELPDGSLKADYSGIRPKLARQGEPAADFRIMNDAQHGIENLVALLGIESPGLTSSLAIGNQVVGILNQKPTEATDR